MMNKLDVFPLKGGTSYVLGSTDWKGIRRLKKSLLIALSSVDKFSGTDYKYWRMLFDRLLRVFAASAMNRSCSGRGQLLIRV